MEIKSRPREHAREEGFKSISSDASSIWHKTSSKSFLVIDILHLVHCFKIFFNYVLPVPMESSVNWSSKRVFVRRNCIELWSNLRRWYLINGHGDLFFLFYISKHCTIDNNLWKFYPGGMTLNAGVQRSGFTLDIKYWALQTMSRVYRCHLAFFQKVVGLRLGLCPMSISFCIEKNFHPPCPSLLRYVNVNSKPWKKYIYMYINY